MNTVELSATDPQFVQKARTVGKRQGLIVTNFLLEGDTQPSTLELQRVEVFAPEAQVVVVSDTGAVTKGPPDTRFFRGTVVGRAGSLAMLSVREDNGVSGLALRGDSSWALGKEGGEGAAAYAPLGSKKGRSGDTGGPEIPIDDIEDPDTPSELEAAVNPAAAAPVVQPAALLQVRVGSDAYWCWVRVAAFATACQPCVFDNMSSRDV